MEIQFKIIGFALIGLALIHFVFPKYFDWKNELSKLSLINKEIMYVHTFFLALVLFLVGLLCITCSNDLVNATLGKNISLGLGIFWGCRLFIQFFGYSAILWKSKKFETAIHIIFSILWAYLTFVFFYNYFN